MRRTKAIGTLAGTLLAVLWIAGCSAQGGENAPQQDQAETVENVSQQEQTETAENAPQQTQTEMAGDHHTEEDADVGETETKQAESAEQVDAQEADPASSQTLSIVGDSISTYEGYIPYGFHDFYPMNGELRDVSQTWWSLLLKDTGMELCANNSSAACTCAGDSQAEDIQIGCSSYRLSFTVGKQGKMPDYIIVYMGINDLLDDIPLGDNDGTALVTEGKIDNFSDAYCLMLEKLESEYPAAQICCCTLTKVGDWGTADQPYVLFENKWGLTAEDYSERIRLIAENRGMLVADLYNCGIDVDSMPEMTSDGVHLTPAGMKLVEAAILNALQDATAE